MRPKNREPAGPGEESVWDYPRPPRLEPVPHRLLVRVKNEAIADTKQGYRVLETSHPPTYYIPPSDVRIDLLERDQRTSLCEWKGQAVYWDIVTADQRVKRAAWSYPDPNAYFRTIVDFFSFYVSHAVVCSVDGETVTPQQGSFYGGWITSRIRGPFKGASGTWGW